MGDCERTSHLRKIRRHQIGKGGWRAEDQGHLSFPSNKLWPVMKDRRVRCPILFGTSVAQVTQHLF